MEQVCHCWRTTICTDCLFFSRPYSPLFSCGLGAGVLLVLPKSLPVDYCVLDFRLSRTCLHRRSPEGFEFVTVILDFPRKKQVGHEQRVLRSIPSFHVRSYRRSHRRSFKPSAACPRLTPALPLDVAVIAQMQSARRGWASDAVVHVKLHRTVSPASGPLK